MAVRSVHVTCSLCYPLTVALTSDPRSSCRAVCLQDSQFANKTGKQRNDGESRTESGADHRLLLGDRPQDGRYAGQG